MFMDAFATKALSLSYSTRLDAKFLGARIVNTANEWLLTDKAGGFIVHTWPFSIFINFEWRDQLQDVFQKETHVQGVKRSNRDKAKSPYSAESSDTRTTLSENDSPIQRFCTAPAAKLFCSRSTFRWISTFQPCKVLRDNRSEQSSTAHTVLPAHFHATTRPCQATNPIWWRKVCGS